MLSSQGFRLFLSTGSRTITVRQRAAGSIVRGKWQEGAETVVEIVANVQPTKPHEMLVLPEADRSKASIKVHSQSPLRTLLEGTGGHSADIIEWDGELWEVASVKRWQMGILDHYRAIAVRLERTPNE